MPCNLVKGILLEIGHAGYIVAPRDEGHGGSTVGLPPYETSLAVALIEAHYAALLAFA